MRMDTDVPSARPKCDRLDTPQPTLANRGVPISALDASTLGPLLDAIDAASEPWAGGLEMLEESVDELAAAVAAGFRRGLLGG